MVDALVFQLLDEATVVVWACGYASNTVPVLAEDGGEITLSRPNGVVEVGEDVVGRG